MFCIEPFYHPGDYRHILLQDGEPVAFLTIASTSDKVGDVSLDYIPIGSAMVRAIPFGAKHWHDEYQTYLDTSKPNGQARIAFMCIDSARLED